LKLALLVRYVTNVIFYNKNQVLIQNPAIFATPVFDTWTKISTSLTQFCDGNNHTIYVGLQMYYAVTSKDGGIDDVSINWQCTSLSISCPAAQTINLSGCSGSMPNVTSGITITQKCDTLKNVTQSVAIGSLHTFGTVSVQVIAYDNSGNKATCTTSVKVINY
jgi:hypothetical protein